MDSETVYINGGQIYKNGSVKSVVANYTYNFNADPLFKFTKNVSEEYPEGKKYIFTKQFKEYFPAEGDNKGIDISSYDLCPDVGLWIALGAKSNTEAKDYDLFFAVQSVAELQAVATYYSLPYPITSEVGNIITNSPDTIHFWRLGDLYIVPAGIQYRNGVPTLLKLYTYPTTVSGWKTWMLGNSYVNGGEVYEKGGIYNQLTGGQDKEGYILRGEGNYQRAESITSNVGDKTSFKYNFTKTENGGDCVIMWEAEETDIASGNKRIRHFESTKMFREVIAKLSSGNNLESYNLASDVDFWLGRSYYDDTDEAELYFVATSSAQVKKVSEHYKLPVPYNDNLKDKLDNNPESLRVRHYDMLGLGEGNFVPVVACGVVFKNSIAVMLKLYEFTREAS
jgi:hypothetical protein